MKKRTGKLAETWGLGASATALCVVLVLSGWILMLHYRPTVEWAWADVVDLREASWAGSMRSLHYWASQLLVIIVWLQLVRTFLRGFHRSPRQRRWAVGVGLLVLTLGSATTGYLLPHDAAAVSGQALHHPLVGGHAASPTPAEDTLTNGSRLLGIYVAHCVLLPLGAVFLLMYRRRLRRRAEDEAS